MELIDKAALIAELDRLYDLEYDDMSNLSFGKKLILRHILLFLNTLEVKEVDLEKEYKMFVDCDEGRSMFEVAKHFFELGLKARKGE